MKTILCAEYQKSRIMRRLMRNNHVSGISDVRLISLNTLLKDPNEEDPDALLLQFSDALKKEKNLFPVYGGMFQYPAFIQEILSFAKQCALLDISSDSLPEDSRLQKEQKQIIQEAMKLNLSEKNPQYKTEAVLKKVQSIPDFSVCPWFETDPYRHMLLQKIIEVSAVFQIEETKEPDRSLFYALNQRQEIESAAQDICLKSSPCAVVLCDYSSQLPVLSQIFARYGIPFSCISEPVCVKTPGIYCSLLRLCLYKDRDSLLDAIQKHAFAADNPDSFIPYLSSVLTDTSCPEAIADSIEKGPFGNNAALIRRQQTAIESYFAQIQDDLNLLLQSDQVSDILQNAYHVLQKSPLLANPDELKASISLRSTLQNCIAIMHSYEDIEFMIQRIESRQYSHQSYTTSFCDVTDLHHPVHTDGTLYVLGCSSSLFPGFKTLSGLFDEDYVSKIKAYPSLQSRNAVYMDQLQWLEQNSIHTIYSYATNDYQGREIQLAYEIESLFAKEDRMRWPLIRNEIHSNDEHHIQKDTAEKLFLSESSIHGSISSIERWFGCPYSYFLESGLKVRSNDLPDLDSASGGSAQHSAMEQLVNMHAKNYTKADKKEIEALLNPYIHDLQKLHPNDIERLHLFHSRMTDSIYTSLQFLDRMEESSLFSPSAVEKHFEVSITEDVVLRGIIDRIDYYEDQLRIIDYKSSAKTLSEIKVKAGTQLQLLSYLIIASDMMQKQPFGAYYFSMRQNKTSIPAGTVKKKETVNADVRNPAVQMQAMLDSRKLSGWTFASGAESPDFFKSLNKPFYFDRTKKCIEEVYGYFAEHLLDGDISVSPDENACAFCDYKAVCRHRGTCRKAVPLVYEDIPLQAKKEDGQ